MADRSIYDDVDDPYRAIRVGDPGPSAEATKWGHLLTRFMRIMALFWLAQGLMQWHVIMTAQKSIFDTMPLGGAFAIIFFGVLDLIAGVGLWLATPWGGVLWLLIASAQIFVAASMPGFFTGGYWLIAVDLVLILLYFALTFEAGRDFEAQRVIDRRRRRRSADGHVGSAPSRSMWEMVTHRLKTRLTPRKPLPPPPETALPPPPSAARTLRQATQAAQSGQVAPPSPQGQRKSAPPQKAPRKE